MLEEPQQDLDRILVVKNSPSLKQQTRGHEELRVGEWRWKEILYMLSDDSHYI